jgi:hypothetical protein
MLAGLDRHGHAGSGEDEGAGRTLPLEGALSSPESRCRAAWSVRLWRRTPCASLEVLMPSMAGWLAQATAPLREAPFTHEIVLAA